jgi:glycosyltransferase involved in cell wall biosynthesis
MSTPSRSSAGVELAEHRAIKVTIVGLNFAPERSGIAAYTTALSEGLAESGMSVHAVTGYPHYPGSRVYEGYSRKLPVERHNGVVITRVRHFVRPSPRRANRFFTELTFGLGLLFTRWRRPDVTILVSPAWLSSAIASIRARLFDIPICIWVQEVGAQDGSRDKQRGNEATQLLTRIERYCLSSATTIVVVHERVKQQLVAELDIPSDRVEVVRNWSSVPLSPGRPRLVVRAEFGWMPDDIVVLNYGGAAEDQGIDSVIQASERASESGSMVRFVVFADGERNLQNTRLDYRAPPADKTLMEMLRAADILLLSEPAGHGRLSVPEELTVCFSAGLPIIAATDESSILADEIALSGGGVRIDPADPDALLSAAEGLASTPDRAAALGESGRRFVAERLSPEPAIAAFSKIIARSIGTSATNAVP